MHGTVASVVLSTCCKVGGALHARSLTEQHGMPESRLLQVAKSLGVLWLGSVITYWLKTSLKVR